LHVYEGLVAAFNEPTVTLEVLLMAEDADEAKSALQARLGLDAVQATVVLDIQFRRVTKIERTRAVRERNAMSEQLQNLRALRGLPSES
jgi:DNA gyrase/topoisomerase IV subunit A